MQAVAKKLIDKLWAEVLKSVVLQMDDLSVEDLPTETNVVL